jgi:hypothetical protein
MRRSTAGRTRLSHVTGLGPSQEMSMSGDLLSGTLIEIARDLREKRVTARVSGRSAQAILFTR